MLTVTLGKVTLAGTTLRNMSTRLVDAQLDWVQMRVLEMGPRSSTLCNVHLLLFHLWVLLWMVMVITKYVRTPAVESVHRTTRYRNICASAKTERGVPGLTAYFW